MTTIYIYIYVYSKLNYIELRISGSMGAQFGVGVMDIHTTCQVEQWHEVYYSARPSTPVNGGYYGAVRMKGGCGNQIANCIYWKDC